MQSTIRTVFIVSACLTLSAGAQAANFYIDATNGSDSNDGASPSSAWKTLAKANAHDFGAGDQILLKGGETFAGTLRLNRFDNGSAGSPLVVASYGTGARPLIDAAGYRAGIQLEDIKHVLVRDLEITANGGATVDGSDPAERFGVYAKSQFSTTPVENITLRNLHIRDIYPEADTPHEGANPTTYMGVGIYTQGITGATASNILIEDTTIERTGFTGIRFQRAESIQVLNNTLTDIGGPGIQPSRVEDMLVEGNTVNRSGSLLDPRMHGRGSGIWPWFSNRVTIQKNAFMNARGREDSTGVHIDFLNNDVIVQHNLSVNNAGGFLEILGDNHNSTYRYNVSINDGWRVEGETDQGSIANNADGRVIYLGGWVGRTNGVINDYRGPYDTYIYNNTVYVKPGQTSHFRVHGSANGALVTNNIFHLEGPVSTEVKGWKANGVWTQQYTQETIDSIIWENNYYEHADSIPAHLPFVDPADEVVGDAQFINPGGFNPTDYIPLNTDEIADQGINLYNLPGDPVGVRGGLAVAEDFLGNPIRGLPDRGAIELSPAMLGDFDNDGDTDLADLILWQRGAVPSLDGLIGLTLWQANAQAGSSTNVALVPEPATVALGTLGILLTRKPRTQRP